MEAGGVLWGESSEGVAQGDPLSMLLFCVGIHEDLVWLQAQLEECGGMVRAGADDVYVVGPLEVVVPKVLEMAAKLKDGAIDVYNVIRVLFYNVFSGTNNTYNAY